jgi:hypothetical protein
MFDQLLAPLGWVSAKGKLDTPPRAEIPDAIGAALSVSTASDIPPLAEDPERERPEREAGNPAAAFTGGAVHEALKGLDVSFGYHVAGLEKEATRLAHSWAERGLPRHDLQAVAPIEVEIELSHRARQVYWQWVRDVRRRVDGALWTELQKAAGALKQAGRSLEGYRRIQHELGTINPRASRGRSIPTAMATADAAGRTAPADTPAWALRDSILAERHLHLAFWPLTVVLVLAEFVANAPVFSELFPQDRELDAVAAAAMSATDISAWLAGVAHLGMRLMTYPEPAFLALIVVVFLLFLSHCVGSEGRAWLVLRRPHPSVPAELTERLLPQARAVAVASTLAVAITLAGLYSSRASVKPMADTRLASVTESFQTADAALADARLNNADNISDLRATRDELLIEREFKQRKADYAASLAEMNRPILGFNLVLVIAAAVAGFHRYRLRVTSEQKLEALASCAGEPAHTATANSEATSTIPPSRLLQLRHGLQQHRLDLCSHLEEADRALGNAKQLAECQPMREWKAIESRLECIVPLFRAENARMRHLDTRTILAFGHAPSLGLEYQPFDANPELTTLLDGYRVDLTRLVHVSEALATTVRDHRRQADALAATGASEVR